MPVKTNCQAKSRKKRNVSNAAKNSNKALGFLPKNPPRNLMLTFRLLISTAGKTEHIIIGKIILPQSKNPGILGKTAHRITASNMVRNEIKTRKIKPTEARILDKFSKYLCRRSDNINKILIIG